MKTATNSKNTPKIIKGILLGCAAAALIAAIANSATLFRRTGWVEKNGQLYYYQEGQIASGWLRLEEGAYYLKEDGTPLLGWLEEDGVRRWFGPDGLMMENGIVGIDGQHFLITDGVMATGLIRHEEALYYLGEDGAMVTGWAELDGEHWYFNPENGHALTGIQTIDGITYAFTPHGPLASGWLEVDGVTYRISEEGTPLPGGWHDIDDRTYYLNDNGSLYEGWLEDEGHTYYMQAGTYTTGILPLEDRNYFFDSRGWKVLMVNPWNTVPEGYEVELSSVGSGHSIAAEAAADFTDMIQTLEQMELGPIITSSYRSGTRQQEIFDERMAGYMEGGMAEADAYALTATSVAIPGTSEHQLGLAIDMTDAQYNKLDEGQMETPTQLWLIENSWRYGFILRYPEGKSEITGIIYEPWHYRYVGKTLAAELYDLGLTLEEYLDMLTQDKALTASNPENGNTMP